MNVASAIAFAASMTLLSATAAEFTVSPLRADLSPADKSASITVANTGRETFGMQVVVRRWTQNAEGVDVFEDSNDLVSFPKRFDIAPGARRVVRVGTNKAAAEAETAYRIFLEELPPITAPGAEEDSKVAVLVTFAVPVFVRPSRPAPMGEIEAFDIAGGKATIRLRNSGNQTLLVDNLEFSGEGVTSDDFNSWYLLPGGTRTYTAKVPPEACATGKLEVIVRLRGAAPAKRETQVSAAQCTG